jgi:hypothetical protein
MDHETDGRRQRRVRESKGKGKEVKVEETEEQKEYAGKEMHALRGSQRNHRKDFAEPDNTQDHKRKGLVAVVKLNEKKDHAHHDGYKDQVIDKMARHQLYHGLSVAYMILQLMRKVQHPLLRFSECKGDQGGRYKKQEARPQYYRQFGSNLAAQGNKE